MAHAAAPACMERPAHHVHGAAAGRDRSVGAMMRAIVVLVTAIWGCDARDHSTAGQDLEPPIQVRLEDYLTAPGYELEMTGEYSFATATGTFNTRAFNNDIPGPTLIMKRGETNRVALVNSLTGPDETYVLNEYGHISSTNIHTHGLHVPHEVPGDDVKIQIEPGMTYNYGWEVPADHAPGTHWYHPHLHGSTALQTAGGAHGMIIIEDEAGDGTPDWLLNIEEKQLIVHHVPCTGETALRAIEQDAGGSVVNAACSADMVLVNGQNAPVIEMELGRWYRWRMVFVAANHWAQLETGSCEFGVLAKDGIYLNDPPRAMSYVQMASGNRVDIVIRCTANSRLESVTGAAGRRRMQAGPAGAEQIAAQTLATISVTTGAASTESLADLSFTPTRPGYLADLQAATVHGSKEIEINGGNGCSVNDAPWAGDGTDHLFTVYESTREEYTISAANHPIHIHVNPIQVIRDDDDWNQPGDWMDVVMSNGVYRQHLADHTGVVIVHCHWLSHEDLGCMSQFTIDSCATDDVAAGVLGTCSTADTGLETWVIVLLAVASAAVFLGGVCLACRVSKSSKKEEGSKP